jgi:Raf kinase inhibitor-like YbhB/YbcL family protein
LIVDDPDAPDPKHPKTRWVHWVLFDLPASTRGLSEAARFSPEATGQGLNDWQRTGYGGPCPPIGRHRYFFRLFALDCPSLGLRHPTSQELERAMEGHILAAVELMATYQKGDP